MMLPYFRFHPNPIRTGAIIESKERCSVCGKNTGYLYQGPFYCIGEKGRLCPWCIANGEAARQFNGSFQDYWGFEEVEDNNLVDEVLHRTPGYTAWQQGEWLSHCGVPCAFMDYVGWKEIKHIAHELVEDIDRFRDAMRMTRLEFEKSLLNNGSLQGYLFCCIKCGKHRLHTDLN